MVSVGLIREIDLKSTSRKATEAEDDPIRLLWSPEFPPTGQGLQAHWALPLREAPDELTQAPDELTHLYMPLQEQDTARHLVRIAALSDCREGIYGLAFNYDDGSELLCGYRDIVTSHGSTIWPVEQSFAVSGSTGEHVTRIEVSFYQNTVTSRWSVRAVKVRTPVESVHH